MRTNPHSALLLDVHTRLLRTNGASFSYLSGRMQIDDELPWFGIGRDRLEFEADRKAFRASVRPLQKSSSTGLLCTSPRQNTNTASQNARASTPSPIRFSSENQTASQEPADGIGSAATVVTTSEHR